MTINAQNKSYSSPALEFKSTMFSVPVLGVASDDLHLIEQVLHEKIKLAPEFFKHSPVILDFQELNKKQLTIALDALLAVVRKAGLFVVGVRGGSEEQHQKAIDLGIAVTANTEIKAELPKTPKIITAPKDDVPVNDDSTTVLITKPIRSGQRIYSHGDLIVLAQVGAGAEILAEGNIHIYGTLRGRALAGVQGNIHARIFC
ncbi:MAG: hypothetical protein RLZZ384_502, partial [Pseudomonadota bacterium]